MLRAAHARGGLALVVETAVRQATLAGLEVPAAAREAGWQPTGGQLNALLPQLDSAFCQQLVGSPG